MIEENEVVIFCRAGPYAKSFGSGSENHARIEQYLGARGWHLPHARDVLVEGLMGSDGPHNHEVNSNLWIRYDPDARVWRRVLEMFNPLRDVMLRTTSAAGAVDIYHGGATKPHAQAMEFERGQEGRGPIATVFPAAVDQHSQTYVVLVNGEEFPAPGAQWPPSGALRFPDPMEVEVEPKRVPERPAEPVAEKPKRVRREMREQIPFTVVDGERQEDLVLNSAEITEMFKKPAFGGKSRFYVAESATPPAEAEPVYAQRKGVAAALRAMHSRGVRPFVHVIPPPGSTRNARALGGGRPAPQTTLILVNKFAPSMTLELTLTGKERIDREVVPAGSLFYRAAAAGSDPRAEPDDALVKIAHTEVAKAARDGHGRILVAPPVRVAQWVKKKANYAPLRAPQTFVSFEQFSARMENAQRAAAGVLRNVDSAEEFRAMFAREISADLRHRDLAESAADARPWIVVPIVYVATGKPETASAFVGLSAPFEPLAWDNARAPASSRGTRTEGAPRTVAAMAAGANSANSPSASPAYGSARQAIIAEAAEAINEGSASVSGAVQGALAATPDLRDEAMADDSLEGEVIMAAMVNPAAGNRSVAEMIASASDPQRAELLVREAKLREALAESRHPLRTEAMDRTMKHVRKYVEARFSAGVSVVQKWASEKTPYRVHTITNAPAGAPPEVFAGGILYDLRSFGAERHQAYESSVYNQLHDLARREYPEQMMHFFDFPLETDFSSAAQVAYMRLPVPRNGLEVRGQALMSGSAPLPSMERFIARVLDVPKRTMERRTAEEGLKRALAAIQGLMSSVASVLMFLRAHYVVHGNVTPENVLFVRHAEGVYPMLTEWQEAGFYTANGELRDVPHAEEFAWLRRFDPLYDLSTFVALTMQAVRVHLMAAVSRLGLPMRSFDFLASRLIPPFGSGVVWEDVRRRVQAMNRMPSVEQFMTGDSREQFRRLGLWSDERSSSVVVEEKAVVVARAMQVPEVQRLVDAQHLTWSLALEFFARFDLGGLNDYAEDEADLEELTRYLATAVTQRTVATRLADRLRALPPVTFEFFSQDMSQGRETVLRQHAAEIEHEVKRAFGADLLPATLEALTHLLLESLPAQHRVFFALTRGRTEPVLRLAAQFTAGRYPEVVTFDVNYQPARPLDEEMPQMLRAYSSAAAEANEEEAEEEEEEEAEDDEEDKLLIEEDGEATVLILGSLRREVDKSLFSRMKHNPSFLYGKVFEFREKNPGGGSEDDVAYFMSAVATEHYLEKFDVHEDELDNSLVSLVDVAHTSQSVRLFLDTLNDFNGAMARLEETAAWTPAEANERLTNFVRVAFGFLLEGERRSAFYGGFLTSMVRKVIVRMRNPPEDEPGSFPFAFAGWIHEALMEKDVTGRLARMITLLELDILTRDDLRLLGDEGGGQAAEDEQPERQTRPVYPEVNARATWKAHMGFDLILLLRYTESAERGEKVRLRQEGARRFYSRFVNGEEPEQRLGEATPPQVAGFVNELVAQLGLPNDNARRTLREVLLGDGTVEGLLEGIGKVREMNYPWHALLTEGDENSKIERPADWRDVRKRALLTLGLYTAFDAAFAEFEYIVEHNSILNFWARQQPLTWNEETAFVWADEETDEREPGREGGPMTEDLAAQRGLSEVLAGAGLAVPLFAAGSVPGAVRVYTLRGEQKRDFVLVDRMEHFLRAVFTFGPGSVLARGVEQYERATGGSPATKN